MARLSLPLADLDPLPLNIPWRQEGDRKTPYSPRTGDMASGPHSTWGGTRKAAQRLANELLRGDAEGGLGLVLGPVRGLTNTALIGLDLDSCRDPLTGEIGQWARRIIKRFHPTYVEISPSGTGVKLFMLCRMEDFERVRRALNGQLGKQWKRKGQRHPPGIEFYMGNRYFTVTGDMLHGCAKQLAYFTADELLWIIDVAGPEFKAEGKTDSNASKDHDESGSGVAFRKAESLHLNGGSIEDFEEWAREHPWGDYDRDSERAIERTWERARIRAGEIALRERNEFDSAFDYLGTKDRKTEARTESTLRGFAMDDLADRVELFDFVEDVLYDGQLSVVVGAPKAGKTFFVLDLCLHVATGRSWHGKDIERGAVLYVALEGTQGIKRRIEAWCIHNRVDPESLPFLVASGTLDLRKDKATRRWIIEQAADLADKTGFPVKLIVIDTLNRAISGGNENSPEDMGAFVAGADFVRIGSNAHVMVIHHPGKDESKGLRGHTSLLGALDTQIAVEAGRTRRVATVEVQKEGEPGAFFDFQLEKVALGYNDRRGKPVTSAVAVPNIARGFGNLDDDGLDTRDRDALRMLGRIIRHTRILDGKDNVHLDEWRDALKKANWPEADTKSGAFRMAFLRARDSLIEKSKIRVDNDKFVSLTDDK